MSEKELKSICMYIEEALDFRDHRTVSSDNKNVSIVHGCPIRNIIFSVQWTMKFGK